MGHYLLDTQYYYYYYVLLLLLLLLLYAYKGKPTLNRCGPLSIEGSNIFGARFGAQNPGPP